MSILEGILGKRQRVVRYRTIDGGHPAPYPDMTDEQLYNYETTFNVPHRTFSQPPHSSQRAGTAVPPFSPDAADAQATSNYAPRTQQWTEPFEAPVMARQTSAQMQRPEQAQPPRQGAQGATQTRPERLRRNRAFDAPRYTRKSAASAPEMPPSANMQADVQPDPQAAPQAATQVVDFSKPVRTITTKQAVDVITTRARHPIYKVHAYIGDDDVVTVFTLDGRLCENGPRFLENAPELRQVHLNIYAQEQGYRVTEHTSREDADAAAQPGRLACVAVQRDA